MHHLILAEVIWHILCYTNGNERIFNKKWSLCRVTIYYNKVVSYYPLQAKEIFARAWISKKYGMLKTKYKIRYCCEQNDLRKRTICAFYHFHSTVYHIAPENTYHYKQVLHFDNILRTWKSMIQIISNNYTI